MTFLAYVHSFIRLTNVGTSFCRIYSRICRDDLTSTTVHVFMQGGECTAMEVKGETSYSYDLLKSVAKFVIDTFKAQPVYFLRSRSKTSYKLIC